MTSCFSSQMPLSQNVILNQQTISNNQQTISNNNQQNINQYSNQISSPRSQNPNSSPRSQNPISNQSLSNGKQTDLHGVVSPSLSQASLVDSAYGTSPALKWAALEMPALTFNDNWRFQITPQDILSTVETGSANDHQQVFKNYLYDQSFATQQESMISPWLVYQQQEDLFSPQSAVPSESNFDSCCPFSPISTTFNSSENEDDESRFFSLSPLTINTIPSSQQQQQQQQLQSLGSPLSTSASCLSSPIMFGSCDSLSIKPVKPRNVQKKSKSKDAKSFPCSMCSSSFSRNHDLKRHIRYFFDLLLVFIFFI